MWHRASILIGMAIAIGLLVIRPGFLVDRSEIQMFLETNPCLISLITRLLVTFQLEFAQKRRLVSKHLNLSSRRM